MQCDKNMFKLFFQKRVHDYRMGRNLTQEHMSELLGVVPRSYVDLEHRKFCPSGWTVTKFLAAQKDEEILQFIHEFCDRSEKEPIE